MKDTAVVQPREDDGSASTGMETPPAGSCTPQIIASSPSAVSDIPPPLPLGVPNATAATGGTGAGAAAAVGTSSSTGTAHHHHQQQHHPQQRSPRPSPLRTSAGIAALLEADGEATTTATASPRHHTKTAKTTKRKTTNATTTTVFSTANHQPTQQQYRAAPHRYSRFRGVVWHKSNCKWEARIYESGKQRFLGYFPDEDTAALAYDDYAVSAMGSAARVKLNFPERYAHVELPPPPHPVTTGAAAKHHHHPQQQQQQQQSPGPAARATAITTTTAQQQQPQQHKSSSGAIPLNTTTTNISNRRGGGGNGGTNTTTTTHKRVQPVKGSSRFRGVSWNSNTSKWRAQVWRGAEVHHVGYFEQEEDAAHAYDEAVVRIRGPGAPVNYPSEQHYSHHHHHHLPQVVGGGGGGDENEMAAASQMLGVSWDEQRNAWVSELWDGERYLLLGAFTTEAEAAHAYDVACLAQQGTDALTNYPLDRYSDEVAAAAILVQLAAEDSTGFGKTVTPTVTPTMTPSTSSFDFGNGDAPAAAPISHLHSEHHAQMMGPGGGGGGERINNINNDVSPLSSAPLYATSAAAGALSAFTTVPQAVPTYQQQLEVGGESMEHQQQHHLLSQNATSTNTTADVPEETVLRLAHYLHNYLAQQQQQYQQQHLPIIPTVLPPPPPPQQYRQHMAPMYTTAHTIPTTHANSNAALIQALLLHQQQLRNKAAEDARTWKIQQAAAAFQKILSVKQQQVQLQNQQQQYISTGQAVPHPSTITGVKRVAGDDNAGGPAAAADGNGNGGFKAPRHFY